MASPRSNRQRARKPIKSQGTTSASPARGQTTTPETPVRPTGSLIRVLIRRHTLALVLTLGFGVVFGRTLGSFGMFMWDEAEYASLARALARGEGYTVNGTPELLRPPVLPLAGALSIAVAGTSDDRVVKRASLAFALLALVVVYAVGARLFEPLMGVSAAVLLGTMPWFWGATARFLSEIPFLAFFALATCGLYLGLYVSARYLYLGWLGFSLAFLTRYTALLFGPVAAVMVLAALASKDPATRRRVLGPHMVMAPLVTFTLLVPWFVRQYLVSGDMWAGVRRASSQLQVYMPDVSMPWHFYFGELERMVSLPVIVCWAVGALVALRKRDRFGVHCLILTAGLVAWFSAYRYKEARLVSAVLPFVALVAAGGVASIASSVGKRRHVAVGALIAIVFALNEPVTRRAFAERSTLGYPSFLQAMAFLREHSAADALVIGANVPQIWWYSERRVRDFPARDALDALLSQAEWVVITDFERGQKSYVRELADQLDEEDVRRGAVYVFRDREWGTLLVRPVALREHM